MDSSNAPEFDFDFLYYSGEEELIFSQLDLRSKGIWSKWATLPPNLYSIDYIMSTQVLTFLTNDRQHMAYDAFSQETFDPPEIEKPSISWGRLSVLQWEWGHQGKEDLLLSQEIKKILLHWDQRQAKVRSWDELT